MTGSGDLALEVVSRFRSRLLEDRLHGEPRSLADYLDDVPRNQWALVARAWVEMSGEGVAPVPETVREDADEVPAGDFGHYRLVRELGRGGQGTVHLAEDLRLGRKVALKVLEGWASVSETAIRRLRREAEVASRVDDPGICTVYETGVESGKPFISMRYVEGQSLAQGVAAARKVAAPAAVGVATTAPEDDPSPRDEGNSSGSTSRRGRAAVLEVVALVEKIARSLHAAHEAGILHRDIKPGNVMVTPSGEPVITDFGIARQEDSELPTLTRTGEVFGTPAYMSPEQLTGRVHDIDRRSDVWSLGALLYECLTLQRPFEAPTREGLYQRILTREPPDPRRLNRALPVELSTVLATCLDKEPDRRYQTALDLAEDLRRVHGRQPIRARPPGLLLRCRRWMQRSPTLAGLVLALLVLLPLVTALTTNYFATRDQVAAQQAAQRAARVESLLMEGMSFLKTNAPHESSPKSATRVFEEVLEVDPGSPEAVAGLIVAALNSRGFEAALELFDEHRSTVARHPDLLRMKAVVLRVRARNEEADEVLATLSEPRDHIGWYLDGLSEMEAGHLGDDQEAYRRSLRSFRRAVLATPHRRALYHFQIAHAAGHCRDAAAIRQVTAVIEQEWPESALAWFWIGVARQGDDLEAAIAAFRKTLDLQPGHAGARLSLGMTLQQVGRDQEALEVLTALVRDHPGFAQAHCHRGSALRAAGRYDEALEAYEKAVALRPPYAEGWFRLGNLHGMRREWDEAIAAYRQSLRFRPRQGRTWFSLGMTLLRKGERDEAVAALRRAREVQPTLGGPFRQHGRLLAQSGDYDAALPLLERAVELEPKHPGAWSLLAGVLSGLGRYDEAAECIKRAIEINGDDAVLHFNLGSIMRSGGHLQEAREALRRAVDLDSENAEAWCYLGLTLQELGRLEDALVALGKGHELSSRRRGWSAPSGEWLAACQRDLRTQARLEDAIRHATPPEDRATLHELARCCRTQRRWVDGARLWQMAFAAHPALSDPPRTGLRYEASRFAARAGTGAGDPAARAAWRNQALTWLREELVHLRRGLDAGTVGESRVARTLDRWTEQEDFERLRNADYLAALPADEREAWEMLWSELLHLLGDLAP